MVVVVVVTKGQQPMPKCVKNKRKMGSLQAEVEPLGHTIPPHKE